MGKAILFKSAWRSDTLRTSRLAGRWLSRKRRLSSQLAFKRKKELKGKVAFLLGRM